jgi:GST-like protein
MIELYTHATPNGHKVSILLEELGLPISRPSRGPAQERADVVRRSSRSTPTTRSRRSSIRTDPDGLPITLWESGAILVYLAEKTGSALLPKASAARYATLQWLMFQMAGVGPMLGQAGHFTIYATEKVPYGVARYVGESRRLLGVMDRQLGAHAYLAGENYSIADIATFPWTQSALRIEGLAGASGELDSWPNVVRWRRELMARPAVQRGLANPRRE